MRIISGSHKGKRLIAPKKLPVRPTTDFAKEGLFNMLRNTFHFSEISVIDLFAGTGNISYEFASRGVEEITCVDADTGCIQFIKKTAAELSFPISTIKSDVFSYLEKSRQSADVIFADPPYDFSVEQFEKIVTLVVENSFLNEDGLLVIEHPKHTDLSQVRNYSNSRKYGSSVFSFFEL